MRLILVRHGETAYNVKGIMQGTADIPLNANGRKQAFEAKDKLKDTKIDVCFSSSLARALETAHIITNKEVITDNRLMERKLGSLEGKSHDLYDSKLYYDYKVNSNKYDVEPVRDLFERVQSFYDEIKTKYKDKTVLIISHQATIRVFNFVINGYNENTNFLSFKVPNCAVLKYDI